MITFLTGQFCALNNFIVPLLITNQIFNINIISVSSYLDGRKKLRNAETNKTIVKTIQKSLKL